MLDAANLPDLSTTNTRRAQSMAAIGEYPYDYNSQEHIHKDFPARERALAILRRFDSTVYVDKLDNSAINYEPMRAKVIKQFNGVPPRQMNREKQIFLEN